MVVKIGNKLWNSCSDSGISNKFGLTWTKTRRGKCVGFWPNFKTDMVQTAFCNEITIKKIELIFIKKLK